MYGACYYAFHLIETTGNIATKATINNWTIFAIIGPSIYAQEMENEYSSGLTPADRKEIQIEKERLVAMLARCTFLTFDFG